MDARTMREINEAINAGEDALYSLRAAQDKLDSARAFGLLDLFGGKSLLGLFKHAQISDARSRIEDAKRALARFQRELKDVSGLPDLNIDIGSFLTFADFFFDGLFADFLVQRKINQAREKLREASERVEYLLNRLRAYARLM